MANEILAMPRQQGAIPWRTDENGKSRFESLNSHMTGARIIATAVASRGTLDPDDCKKCAGGGGPFEGCWRLADYLGKACANCQWDNQVQKCKHHPKHDGKFLLNIFKYELVLTSNRAHEEGGRQEGEKEEDVRNLLLFCLARLREKV